ncbi:hypothetical protein Tco_0404328 [Tanacetum coccineum]
MLQVPILVHLCELKSELRVFEKIRIHRYIRGKPNGKQIWKSIQNGPTPHPMITDPPTTDSAAVPAPRKKLDSEFSEEENKLEMADTQAEIHSSHDSLCKDQVLEARMDMFTTCMRRRHVARACKEQRERWTLSTLKDKAYTDGAKEKGYVLDAEAGSIPPDVFESRITKEEHLDSDAETEIDDNTIPYHQYLLDTEAQNVPTEVPRNPGLGYMAKRAQPVLYDADTLLHPTHHPVSIWDSEEVLVHQVELSREQAYWLPANERASQTSNPNSPVTPFVRKSRPPSQVLTILRNVNAVFLNLKEIREFEQIFDELEAEYEQCVLDNKNLTIEKKNLLIKNDCLIAECLEIRLSLLFADSDKLLCP